MSIAGYRQAMRHRSTRPTQKDIALAAGVSQATVSIVLNKVETSSVPEATRERILKLAGEVGYQPNHPARILRSARTMTLACIVPDITNPFYPGLVAWPADDGGTGRLCSPDL